MIPYLESKSPASLLVLLQSLQLRNRNGLQSQEMR